MRCSSDWPLFMCIHVTWTRQHAIPPVRSTSKGADRAICYGCRNYRLAGTYSPALIFRCERQRFVFQDLLLGRLPRCCPHSFSIFGVCSTSLYRGNLIPRGERRFGEPGRGLALHIQTVLRSLSALVGIASAVVLAGCYSESAVPVSGRHMVPLSERIVADLESRNMAKGAPILLQIFKEESELEVWKIDGTGRFACCGPTPSAAGPATWGRSFNKVTDRPPRDSMPSRPT